MYICFPYTYTLILLLIGYSGCSDKPTNTQGSNSNEDNLPKIGGISLVDYSDSDEEDNFQVTETTETLIEEITDVLDETHTEEITETDVLDETQTEPETTQTQTETQAEPVKDVETQTDLEHPHPQKEPESDDNQRKEKLHVLYYVPPPQEPYGIYQQIVAIPPIKPLPPPIPGESPKYYLISAEQNKYGEHETIPVTYMEYKPILQPVLYYEPIIGPDSYPPVQYPSVSYPVVIPPPIQPTQQSTKETSQETSITKEPTLPSTQPQETPQQPIQPTQEPIQPSQEPSKDSNQTLNLGPGILGPAPGPLRDPSQLLEEYGPTQQRISTVNKPSHPNIRRHIQILKRPIQRPSKEPTKTTKEQTTQSTQEPTQPTQHTTEPATELHPETIPVEIGSEEEEEPPQPPKGPTGPQGPGDGDQPPDQPEGGEGEGEDDEKDDKDKKDKEPPKVVKKCKEVKFMKKDEKDNLIPMTECDYKIKYSSVIVTKYEFLANLEELHCDGKTIFIHEPSCPYPKLITHNRCDDNFIFLIGEDFVTLSLGKKRWSSVTYKIPDFVKLYKHDNHGNLVEMSRDEYVIDFALKYSFKYIMRKNISCIKVQVANLVAWEKNNDDTELCGFSISSLNSVVLRFHKYTKVVTIKNGAYKVLFTKSKKKWSKQ